jgi:hypothetical protein
MELFSSSSTNDCQWALYKQLELIPPSTPNPYDRSIPLAFAFNPAWRSLLRSLLDELVQEQQIEYLDRCWALNAFGKNHDDSTVSKSLHKLWVLMS